MKLLRAKVYRYKKGKKQKTVKKYIIGKFPAGYLCITDRYDYLHGLKFKTEWYPFKEE